MLDEVKGVVTLSNTLLLNLPLHKLVFKNRRTLWL